MGDISRGGGSAVGTNVGYGPAGFLLFLCRVLFQCQHTDVGNGPTKTRFLSLILFLVPSPNYIILYCAILSMSPLISDHTEYLVLCGFGVPSLRPLWGVVRNRQVYIWQKRTIFLTNNLHLPVNNYAHWQRVRTLGTELDAGLFSELFLAS